MKLRQLSRTCKFFLYPQTLGQSSAIFFHSYRSDRHWYRNTLQRDLRQSTWDISFLRGESISWKLLHSNDYVCSLNKSLVRNLGCYYRGFAKSATMFPRVTERIRIGSLNGYKRELKNGFLKPNTGQSCANCGRLSEGTVGQRSDPESRIDRKLTVDRFSINFRGHKRNGTGNFPCNFQQDILSPVIPVARVLSCLNRGLKFLERSRCTCT